MFPFYNLFLCIALKIAAGAFLFCLISNVLVIAYLTRPSSSGGSTGYIFFLFYQIFKTNKGRYHSIRATCVVKFWFFRKNHSGPFVHITWYHLIAKKRPKVPLPGAFSFWAFFPKNLQFCKICPDPHILGPTIKCYTISESSRLPRRRATLVIYLVASTNEK